MRPKIKNVMSLADLAKALAAIGTAATTAVGVLWGSYNWFTTDAELLEHNLNPKAHTALLDRVERMEKLAEKLSARGEDTRASTVQIMRRMIRLAAAERERNPSLRKAAADFYEEELEAQLRRDDVSLEDAFLEALRAPWRDRPNVR